MDFTGVLLSILPSALPLAAWIVGVVFAVKMVRQKGGRAERFLLAGACLMLLASILVIPTSAFGTWLRIDREMTNVQIALWLSIFDLIRGIISLAGIVCLVYAFWQKFKTKPTPT